MIAAIVANVREDLDPAHANAAAASVRARIEDLVERGFVGTGEACRHLSAGKSMKLEPVFGIGSWSGKRIRA
ncbi:MAG: hypothetical protein WBF43_02840 [Methylocella sp.]